jgi:hypothetical protein
MASKNKKPTTKLSILIDANALSHLSQIELSSRQNQKIKANNWLWRHFNILTSKSVMDEFLNGPRKGNINLVRRKLRNDPYLIPESRNLKLLENNWLSHTYLPSQPLGKKDEGERHLICLAIEEVKKKTYPQMVIVSDDLTARKNFMSAVNITVPFGDIWSSLDLIVYLYFTSDEVDYRNAEKAIIDIVSNDSFPVKWDYFKNKADTNEDILIRLRNYYLRKIKELSQIKSLTN